MARLPDFILIGPAQGCTTWLRSCLAHHPQVWLRTGNLNWFVDNPKEAPAEYARHFDPEMGVFFDNNASYRVDLADARIGEKSPDYLFLPRPTIERLHKLMPRCRFVMTSGDPVRRLWAQLRRSAAKRGQDLENADSPWTARFLAENAFKSSTGYFEAIWRDIVGDALLTVHDEQVIEDPHGEFAEVCTHLRIAPVTDPTIIRPICQLKKSGAEEPGPDEAWSERLSNAIRRGKEDNHVPPHRRAHKPRCPSCGRPFTGVIACKWCGILPETLSGEYRLAHVASFPKSGRTWLAYLYYFYTLAHFDRPDIDFGFTYNPQLRGGFQRLLAREGRGEQYPLITFSHAGARGAEAGVERLAHRIEALLERPTVLIVRDPRAVLVSYFHHLTSKSESPAVDLSGFLRDDRHGVRRVVEFLNGWTPHIKAGHPNLHVLEYEHLRADPPTAFAGVLEFLGEAPVDLAALDFAVRESAFEKMQARELEARRAVDPTRASAGDLRMRRAREDAHREEMSAADLDYVESFLEEALDPVFSRYR